MTVTLTYDPLLARVRISATSLGGPGQALVERSTDLVRWTTVRGGTSVTVTSGALAVPLDDYEFAADLLNTFRVAPTLPEDFEDTPLSISASGTWVRDDTVSYAGTWSYRSASITDGQTSDAVITVPAGATALTLRYRVSSEPGFDFFRILVDAAVEVEASGEVDWTGEVLDVTGAGTVTLRYVKDGSDSAGSDTAWVDQLVFGWPAETEQITPVLGGVWLKSVARSYLNRRVSVGEISDISRPSRAGIFDVVGRSYPLAVHEVRGSKRWTMTVRTADAAEGRAVELLLASGDTLYVHTPADRPNVPGGYVSVGDAVEHPFGPIETRRRWSLPCTQVAAPGPDVVGVTATCASILAAYATCADVLAAFATCSDLLEYVASPEDVIVP